MESCLELILGGSIFSFCCISFAKGMVLVFNRMLLISVVRNAPVTVRRAVLFIVLNLLNKLLLARPNSSITYVILLSICYRNKIQRSTITTKPTILKISTDDPEKSTYQTSQYKILNGQSQNTSTLISSRE